MGFHKPLISLGSQFRSRESRIITCPRVFDGDVHLFLIDQVPGQFVG